VRFEPHLIAGYCRVKGQLLKCAPLDGVKLLWAVAGVESSFGIRCVPRHEDEYCDFPHWHQKADGTFTKRAGLYSAELRDATKEIQCAAHCSWGPWQVMYANTRGYNWIELQTDPDLAGDACVQFLNRDKLKRPLPVDPAEALKEFARRYNGSQVTEKYVADLKAAYESEMPA
jgi:hypothetical protein